METKECLKYADESVNMEHLNKRWLLAIITSQEHGFTVSPLDVVVLHRLSTTTNRRRHSGLPPLGFFKPRKSRSRLPFAMFHVLR